MRRKERSEEVVHVGFVVELYELLTVGYPGAGVALMGGLMLLLLIWGIRASAY